MYNIIKQYDDLLSKLNSSDTLFGTTLTHSFEDGFPLISNDLVDFNNVVSELKWYLQGKVDVKTLWDMGNHSWDDILYERYKVWTLSNKHLGMDLFTKEQFIETIKNVPDFSDGWGHPGPMYGKQWRDWNVKVPHKTMDGVYHTRTIDQIQNLINELKTNPNSRRLIVSAWNPGEVIRAKRVSLVKKLRKKNTSEEEIAKATGFSISYLKKI